MNATISRLTRLCAGVAAMACSVAALAGTTYVQTNIVSDGAVPASVTDPNLKNPWGLAFGASTPFWVANNGTGTATIYDPSGATLLAPVTVPGAGGQTGAPTGQVFNGTSSFKVGSGTSAAPALFLFVGEDGVVSGWNSDGSALAVNSSVPNAVYKGATLLSTGGQDRLYIADFHNNKVRVLDGNFQPVTTSGSFADPNLPAGYAPFNVQTINGKLYVTYALQDSAAHDDVSGAGHGFVDIYDGNGVLLQRFASQGTLDSPWGLAMAPANFGQFSNDVLVGNFGDGRINAFSPAGTFLGQLAASTGQPLTIDGLWSLQFGNGTLAGQTNQLFFTAGINGEADGLFGRIDAGASSPSGVPLPPMAYVMPLTLGIAAFGARRLMAARSR
jgi:uncharacterized protein (TIGR03118 family)